MDKTIDISLGGRDQRFRLDEDAYERLSDYLDRLPPASGTIPTGPRSSATSSGPSATS